MGFQKWAISLSIPKIQSKPKNIWHQQGWRGEFATEKKSLSSALAP